jgi:competence protein ComEC
VNFVIAGWIALLGLGGVSGTRASLTAIPVIALFAMVAGGSPSIVRACAMGAFALLGQAIGRDGTRLVLKPRGENEGGPRGLAVAVLAMTGWNPGLLHDPGFQMSVACVLGIVVLSPLLAGRLRFVPGRIRASVAVTLATQLMVAPLAAYYFGTVSLAGLAANLVVVPLCELLLGLGFALVAASALPLPLLWRATAVVTWVVGTGIMDVVAVLRRVPLCSVQVATPSAGEVVGAYAALWVTVKLAARRRVPEREVDGGRW